MKKIFKNKIHNEIKKIMIIFIIIKNLFYRVTNQRNNLNKIVLN